jgi:hypothetical protein
LPPAACTFIGRAIGRVDKKSGTNIENKAMPTNSFLIITLKYATKTRLPLSFFNNKKREG